MTIRKQKDLTQEKDLHDHDLYKMKTAKLHNKSITKIQTREDEIKNFENILEQMDNDLKNKPPGSQITY